MDKPTVLRLWQTAVQQTTHSPAFHSWEISHICLQMLRHIWATMGTVPASVVTDPRWDAVASVLAIPPSSPPIADTIDGHILDWWMQSLISEGVDLSTDQLPWETMWEEWQHQWISVPVTDREQHYWQLLSDAYQLGGHQFTLPEVIQMVAGHAPFAMYASPKIWKSFWANHVIQDLQTYFLVENISDRVTFHKIKDGSDVPIIMSIERVSVQGLSLRTQWWIWLPSRVSVTGHPFALITFRGIEMGDPDQRNRLIGETDWQWMTQGTARPLSSLYGDWLPRWSPQAVELSSLLHDPLLGRTWLIPNLAALH